MALTNIEYGSIATSKILNDNFNYLEGKIEDYSKNIGANNSSLIALINSQNATVTNNLNSINNSLSNLEKEIDTNASSTSAISNSLATNGLYITTYVNGTSWYREFFSDSGKKTRVWLEQGGQTNTNGNTGSRVTFIKPFSNPNYTITLGRLYNHYEAEGIIAYDSAGFTIANNKGWKEEVRWYACGK